MHPFKRRIDSNIYDKLDKLLDTIGIPEHDGRLYLCKAIILAYLDFRYVHSLTSRLYPDVGSIFGCTSARVERAMRYVIEQAWKLGRIDEQYKIFGGTIDAQRGKPTCGEMIAQIAGILRMEGSK